MVASMDKKQSLLFDQISVKDWEKTPRKVQCLIEQFFNEGTLPEAETRLLQFLDATPIGIAVHDRAGDLIYLNQFGRNLLRYHDSFHVKFNEISKVFQIYRSGTEKLYPQEKLPVTFALQRETTYVDDMEIRFQDCTISLEASANPILNKQKQVIYAIIAFQDISDRKRNELEQQILQNTLRKNESHYRQLVQSQKDIILRSLPDTTITFANEALCNNLGQSYQEVLGQKWNQFVPPEDIEVLNRKIAALTPENPTFENINRDYRSNNEIGWTQWLNLGIFDEEGTLIEIQSTGRDITGLQHQIQREKALNQVFQAIRNSLDLETIFATATEETARLLSPHDCFVVQYFPEKEVWQHIAEYRHDPEAPTTIGFEIPDQDNPFADQLKQLQTVQVENTNQIDDQTNRVLSQNLAGAWLLIPLVIENRVWGSFTLVCANRPCHWQEEDVKLAQAVANQLEIAIYQANLYQQAQSELQERYRVERALRESQTRLKNVAANVPGAIFQYILRPDGSDGVFYLSAGCYELWEIKGQAVRRDATPLWEQIHPEDHPRVWNSVLESARTLESWFCAWRNRSPSGKEKWLEAAGKPMRHRNGDVVWDTVILDVTDRKQAEEALKESEARYRLLAENSHDLICLHDLSGCYRYISPSCELLLGYKSEELLGEDPCALIHPDERDRAYQELFNINNFETLKPVSYRVRRKSGDYIWLETLTKPIRDDSGKVIQLQTTSRNITERVQVQSQLEHEALHDALTGLPNRYFLMERLELAINRAQRISNYQFAVVVLDLDRFKVVNDSLGHFVGDQLLIKVAKILQETLSNIDFIARLGGDEFVILLEDINDFQSVIHYIDNLFGQLETPFNVVGRTVYLSTSAGIVFGSNTYTDASDLLRNADLAMNRAKDQGKGQYEIFAIEMYNEALHCLHLENDLFRAFDAEEFVLFYQPVYDIQTEEIAGFEALIRWQHPEEGLKSPGEFLAVAEEIELITALDYWGLRTACFQLAQWQSLSEDFAHLKMNVNLSGHDLKHSELLTEIDRSLSESGLRGECLILEITESMLLVDVEETIQLLETLKTRGIKISIDDFGTGYSSFSYLHRLPADSLKVDRSFVDQMQEGKKTHNIVKTILTLTNELELSAIAEGIETQQQLDQLRKLGYQFGQGYFFSRPLSADQVTAKLLEIIS